MVQSKKGLCPGSATSWRIISEVISLIFPWDVQLSFPGSQPRCQLEAVMGKEMMQMLIMWLKSSCFDSPILRAKTRRDGRCINYSKCLYIFSFNIKNPMRKVWAFSFTNRESDMEKFTQMVYKNLNSGLSVSKGYRLVHWTWYLMADSRSYIICWVCKDKSEIVLAVHQKVMIIFKLGPNFWMM